MIPTDLPSLFYKINGGWPRRPGARGLAKTESDEGRPKRMNLHFLFRINRTHFNKTQAIDFFGVAFPLPEQKTPPTNETIRF
jgi:hypothetical protein